MLGRRAVAVAALVSAAAFGGGAALAATHGNSTQPVVKTKPALHRHMQQMQKQLPRNVHYGCHHDHSSGAANAALNL
jgi:hypothetical protein